MTKIKTKKRKKGIKEWGLALLLALILAIFIKGFVMQSFVVASTKMEKTILKGDFIMVNKMVYGARLPITLLSVPFFSSIYSDLIELPYFRFPAMQSINRNDLVAFNYPSQLDPPIDKKESMIKRCIAIYGDTIEIKDKRVFVNNKLNANTDLMQFNFRLVTNGKDIDQRFLDKYDINEGGMVSEIGIYDFPIDNNNLELVKADENIRYVRELKDFSGENTQYVFPIGKYYSFNKDNFGPLVVPFKGQEVTLNARTIELYKDIIVVYEGNELTINNYKFFINGRESSKYIIQNNYYFMLDDNRDNAKDSRYWGFLPESYIVGKASFIWFSFDKSRGKVRWNRIFKSI